MQELRVKLFQMIKETDFETFLYISKNKYKIFVYDKNSFKDLYN